MVALRGHDTCWPIGWIPRLSEATYPFPCPWNVSSAHHFHNGNHFQGHNLERISNMMLNQLWTKYVTELELKPLSILKILTGRFWEVTVCSLLKSKALSISSSFAATYQSKWSSSFFISSWPLIMTSFRFPLETNSHGCLSHQYFHQMSESLALLGAKVSLGRLETDCV